MHSRMAALPATAPGFPRAAATAKAPPIHRNNPRDESKVTAQTPEQDGKARHGDGLLLVDTILISGLNNATLASARLVLPMIALGLHVGTAQVGIMAALFTLVPMIFSVGFGRWVDRTGTLVPILSASGLILLASLLFEVFPAAPVLYAVAGLIGAGAVFSHVAAARAVGEIGAIADRPRNLGYLVVAYSVFQFLGPMVAGLAYQFWGAAAALFSIGASALLAALLVFVLPHNFDRSPSAGRTDRPGPTTELLRIPALRQWLIISAVFSSAQTIYPFIISLHALEVGLSPAAAGLMLGAFAIGTAISRLSVGMITRRFSGNAISRLALIGGALGYALLPLARDFAALSMLSLVLGVIIGIGVPIALALIYGAAPERRVNEAIGLCMAITNFLQTATPLLLGFLASGLGSGAMTWALALGMAASSALTLARR
ncbi:Predicted arabinose efflux permease, MFS family [Paracoccus pantotrophus]|nr:Predicted arabinose efflux permease, MFS family [Paracoccus pantotrophus]